MKHKVEFIRNGKAEKTIVVDATNNIEALAKAGRYVDDIDDYEDVIVTKTEE